MATAVDEDRCPLCGRGNHCVMASAKAAGAPAAQPCWCSTLRIAPEALARIPEAARMRACLCPACATQVPAAEPPQR